MIKKYLRQSWLMMRTEKLYSSLYIGGVALSIAAVMVLSMALYANLAPLYPEYNRLNTVYFDCLSTSYKAPGDQTMQQQWWLSEWTVNNVIDSMKTIDKYAAFYKSDFDNRRNYSDENGNEVPLNVTYVNPGFFKVYDFDFVEGRPLSDDEFKSDSKVVILSDLTAERLFGSPTGCTGRLIKINYLDYKVIGVVKEPSNILISSAMAYIPYSTDRNILPYSNIIVGALIVTAIPKDGVTLQQMADEFRHYFQPVITANKDINLEVNTYDRPISHYTRVFGGGFDDSPALGYFSIIAVILLIVPAMNLSGMIVGRMEQRKQEMGIRKSFGAKRRTLLWQVIVENMLLTLTGAIIGLVLSWILINTIGSVIFGMIGNAELPDNTRLTPEMLFSPGIFGLVLILTLVLNLLSSYIPVWWSLRHPIVESLNQKR